MSGGLCAEACYDLDTVLLIEAVPGCKPLLSGSVQCKRGPGDETTSFYGMKGCSGNLSNQGIWYGLCIRSCHRREPGVGARLNEKVEDVEGG